MVKNQPTLQEMWVRSLGEEDPLEDEMATHSSILARKIPWTEEPGGLQVMGSQRDMTEQLNNNPNTSDLNAVKKTKKGKVRGNALGRQMLFWKGDGEDIAEEVSFG